MLAHVVATTTEEIVASLPRKALATGHFLVFGLRLILAEA